MFRGGLVISSPAAYDAIVLMLNAESLDERDKLTKQWRDHKLGELNFVGTVAALVSTVLTSTGAWPDILSNGKTTPWYIRTIWWSGIMFALFAVITAAQQALRLHRLSSHKHGLGLLRQSMVYTSHSTEHGRPFYRPARIMVYAWQISLAFLVASIACMIIGMLISVWVSATWGPDKRPENGWWDEGSKLAVTFTVVFIATQVSFAVSQTALTEPRMESERDYS